jgi:hypothetical protein
LLYRAPNGKPTLPDLPRVPALKFSNCLTIQHNILAFGPGIPTKNKFSKHQN